MAKQKAFPKQVYVSRDEHYSEHNNLLAWYGVGDGVEDDGPTEIAVYELKEVIRVRKALKFD